ncbi:hypothetical protein HAX54_024583 [Datura stramonium]|uniref:Uncharacterized protein n=1 Tax=Datura stramonium TaxID=4076 RepID=A0ABS8V0E6_DATST|nr:hypothetical protein [Datura stramonium]
MVGNPENWPWRIIWKTIAPPLVELPALLGLQSFLVLALLMTIHDACFTWVLSFAVDALYMKKFMNQLITNFSPVISQGSYDLCVSWNFWDLMNHAESVKQALNSQRNQSSNMGSSLYWNAVPSCNFWEYLAREKQWMFFW